MPDDRYFPRLSKALSDAGLYQPSLVLDLDRLSGNITKIRRGLCDSIALRIVDKSLPCIPLLERVRDAFKTNRFMTFHLPISAEVLHTFPDAELLLGKPMPVAAVGHALTEGVLAGNKQASNRIVWLIDTNERLAAYGALAAELGIQLRFCFEVDIGLHRGGYPSPAALEQAMTLLKQFPGLICEGIMSYEAHISHVPTFLGGGRKAQAKSTSLLRQFAACLGADQRKIINTGGSSTSLLYDKWIAANEASMGSAFVLPVDFDVPSLSDLQPAMFIGTPVLKVGDAKMPGLDDKSWFLQMLGLFPRRGCFIYGGKWMAEPAYPKGMKVNKIMGYSTNQQFMALPDDSTLAPDDFAFFRPTQSEFVMQQFGSMAIFSGNQIVDRWPTVPLADFFGERTDIKGHSHARPAFV
ncbi:alanine racemase [Phyllobacterium sp. OV277]|uniref:alanine racemase n=1 Tax=Phyllobacterium sp. OV277 TaxID=1882772 RepID=UPI00088F6A44|nr:alanine racemase [Phyllobacterium sp. OV277]SDP68511.1 D-serine deaminase, pyridoxal phosphate-dependent [Phyllobacterium sp. OV277]